MQIELITKQDLQLLRKQILEDLRPFLTPQKQMQGEWLKSADVRRLLKISPGTLQKLRIDGTLKPVRISGSFYYRQSDIDTLLKTGS